MHRRLVAIGFVALLALGSACSSDKDKDNTDGDGATATTTTVAPTTTTSVTAPNGPVTTPEGAAKGLFSAWQRGDRNDASHYARQRAIDALFAHPNTGDVTYANQGCSPEGGQFLCSWTYPGGAMQMTVEGVLGNSGYVVDNVTYIAD
jgi:hypothetical protein